MKRIMIVIAVVAVLSGCATPYGMKENLPVATVSVSGTGLVFVDPDMASLTVSVSELAATTAEALQAANLKMAGVLEAVHAAGVADKDVATMAISFNPEYEWTDGRQVLRGQRASQSVSVKIREIDKELTVLSRLIDALGLIDNISVSSISFSKDDPAEAYAQSRKLAVAKAFQKALDYAGAAGMTVGKPVSIIDSYSADVQTVSMGNMYKAMESVAYDGRMASAVPAGKLEISSTVSIVYELE